jgi:hypothetical protein
LSDDSKSASSQRSWLPAVAVLLGVLGFANYRNGTPSAPTTAMAPSGGPGGGSGSDKGATGPFEITLGLHASVAPRKPSSSDTLLEPLNYFLYSNKTPPEAKPAIRWQLETLIVCVPNPIDSAAGYHFDLVVESLEAAMSAQGFVRDRFVFPWRDFRDRVAADPKRRYDREERQRLREAGAILFRRSERGETETSRRLVMILLVGESPLLGISKKAFDDSVRLIRKDLPAEAKKPKSSFCLANPLRDEIPVLGPFFSGSADSLAIAIAEWLGKNDWLRFNVVSGSAMNVDKDAFEASFQQTVRVPFAPPVHFHATIAPSSLLQSELIRFVYDHRGWLSQPRIAWLRENSVFGHGQGLLQNPVFHVDGEEVPITEFSFPIHISRVRSAYNAALDTARQQLPELPSQRQLSTIPFDDPDYPRDVLPQFAEAMTATSVDMVLNQITTGLARDRFNYVGITATDTRDRIFLTELVRQHCPDAQILVIENDLLFLHAQARDFFKGALVGSTYPLTPYGHLPLNLAETEKYRFPNEPCTGIFNAAILLCHPNIAANCDSPTAVLPELSKFSQDDLEALKRLHRFAFRYRCSCGTSPGAASDKFWRKQPGIWITVVGNDAFWPLQTTSIRQAAERRIDLPRNDNTKNLPAGPGDANRETERAKTDVLVNYTTSARVQENLADTEERIVPPTIATHFDAFDRIVIVLVLFAGASEVTRFFRGRGFWRWWLDHEQSELRLKAAGAELTAFREVRQWAGLRRPGVLLFSFRGVVVLLVTLAAAYLCAIRVSDLIRGDVDGNCIRQFLAGLAGCAVLTELTILFAKSKYRAEKDRAEKHPAEKHRVKLKHPSSWQHAWRGISLLLLIAIVGILIGGVYRAAHLQAGNADRHRQLAIGPFFNWIDVMLFVFASVVLAELARMIINVAADACDTPATGRGWDVVNIVAVVLPTGLAAWLCYCTCSFNWNAFFFERAAHSLSGVSLWTSWLLVMGCFYLYAWARLKALQLIGNHLGGVTKPEVVADPHIGREREMPWPVYNFVPHFSEWTIRTARHLEETREHLVEMLRWPLPWLRRKHPGRMIVVVGILVLWLALLFPKSGLNLYLFDRWLAAAMGFAVTLFFVLWVTWLYSVITFLKEIETLFDQITWLPLTRSLSRLPTEVKPFLGRSLYFIQDLHDFDLRIPESYIQTMKQSALETSAADPGDPAAKAVATKIQGVMTALDPWMPAGHDLIQRQNWINAVSQSIWHHALNDEWTNRRPENAFDVPLSPAALAAEQKKPAQLSLLELADDFIAIQLILYCNPLLRYAWRAFFCVALSAFLFLLAIASYAAPPQGFFGTTALSMMGVMAVVAAFFATQIERNQLLSRVAGTTPGKINFDWTFIFQSLALFVIPLLVVINYMFPGALDWLQDFIAPLFRVLK